MTKSSPNKARLCNPHQPLPREDHPYIQLNPRLHCQPLGSGCQALDVGRNGSGTSRETMRIATYIALTLIPVCMLLSWALRVPVVVVTEAIDANGHIISDEHGDPVLAQSIWLTWKANLIPNVLLIISACLLVHVVLYVWIGLRPRHLPGGGRHLTARKQMPKSCFLTGHKLFNFRPTSPQPRP